MQPLELSLVRYMYTYVCVGSTKPASSIKLDHRFHFHSVRVWNLQARLSKFLFPLAFYLFFQLIETFQKFLA